MPTPPPTLLELFRVLASFSPPRGSLRGAPWDEYVDWSIAQGLAPLAAYNLEFRLGGADAPEWARDRLLSLHQGVVNDNVMKAITFKNAVRPLEGRKVLLLSGVNFAEAVYPHVGFRPVPDIELLVRPEDVKPFSGFLSQGEYRPSFDTSDRRGAASLLTDGRANVYVFTQLLGEARAREEAAVFERALPVKVYGPSVFRPDLEDAILLTVLDQARAGYEIPFVTFVDLRELVLGAPSLGGDYSRPFDPELLRVRARTWKLERAVWTSLEICRRLFPETDGAARPRAPAAAPRDPGAARADGGGADRRARTHPRGSRHRPAPAAAHRGVAGPAPARLGRCRVTARRASPSLDSRESLSAPSRRRSCPRGC